MAAWIGHSADTLRAVGSFIDQAHVPWARVSDRGEYWAIGWAHRGVTEIPLADLDALRLVARLHRGLDVERPAFGASQQLRALGAFVDQALASTFTVSVEPGGLRLSMRVVDQEGARSYSLTQLEELARDQQEGRFP